MTTRLRYFAYGSNLLPQRLRERVPSACLVGSGYVNGRTLRFHKLGGDGSGKCDCHATGDPNDRLWGAVYEMDAHEKPDLDAVEGPGYTAIEVEVSLSSSRLSAYTYVAIHTHVVPGLCPFDWYKSLVLAGARYHRLDEATFRGILAISAVPDPDGDRAARHWRLITDHASVSVNETPSIADNRARNQGKRPPEQRNPSSVSGS